MIQWLVRRRRGACILYSIQLHCFMDDTAHGRHQWISQALELFSFLSARTPPPPHIKARDLKVDCVFCPLYFSSFLIVSLFLCIYVSDESAAACRQPVRRPFIAIQSAFVFFVQRKVFCRHDLHEFCTLLFTEVVDPMGEGAEGIPATEGVSHSLIPFFHTKDR